MANELQQYRDGKTSSHGANVYTEWYDRKAIEATPLKDIYQQFASKREMPTKWGKTYSVRRWLHTYDRAFTDADFASKGFISSRDIADVSNGFTAAALAEGTTQKNPIGVDSVLLKTTLARYGEELDYTDEVDLFSNDDVQVRYRSELYERACLLYEDLIQLDMLSTNTVMYSGLGTNVASMGTGLNAAGTLDDSYRVSYDLLAKAVRKLRRNRAEKNTSMVTGSTKIDTKTVEAAYYAIVGPEVAYDLRNLTRGEGAYERFAFIEANKYASASTLAQGEIGQIGEIRFIESDTAVIYRGQGDTVPKDYVGTLSNTNGKFDVFPILFPTKDSFATVGLKGQGKVKFNSKAPGEIDSGNRFGTRGFFTYNMWYGGIILQEEKLLKILVLASA